MGRRRSARYLSYLRFPAWFAWRAQHLARYGADCKACGSTAKIDLHHKTYVNLGQEKAAELVALCESCHKAVHRYARAACTPPDGRTSAGEGPGATRGCVSGRPGRLIRLQVGSPVDVLVQLLATVDASARQAEAGIR